MCLSKTVTAAAAYTCINVSMICNWPKKWKRTAEKITHWEATKVNLLLVEKKEDQPNVTNRFPPSNKDRGARAAQ